MRKKVTALAAALLGLAAGTAATAQEAPAPEPTPAPPEAAEAEKKEPKRFRPIESNVIVNLPSVEVPSEGTLTFLVTHRFVTPLQDGNIDNFFTLDTGNTWGFGLWYAPVKNLNAGFYRSSDLNTYEASAQYELPRAGGFASSLRIGEDWRTQPGVASPHSSFFAQAVLAYSFGQYVRLSAVPTYLQRTNQFPVHVPTPTPNDQSCRFVAEPPDPDRPYRCSGLYENVFNVPVAASIAITHSITIHGEVYPRLSKVNSNGVGWSVTVEKSLLRHRFAFFAGNQRQTTVDEYTQAVLDGRVASNVYIGFNLFRAWKLK
jgi:Membrane bound beta barrel domain (DUF5777)